MVFCIKKYGPLFLVLLLFSSAILPTYGQTEEEDYLYEPLEEKTFNNQEWETIHKALDYSGEPPKPKKTETIEETEPWNFSMPDLSPLVKIFAFILLISLIGLVMYHIINRTDYKFNEEETDIIKGETALLSLEELEEQLDKRDVNPYILKAEEQHNYPLAVRLHFLSLLKKLNETDQINWRKNYTNNTYLNQMRGKDNYAPFKQLTKKYERVWYGDKHPLRSEYEIIRDNFKTFHLTIKPSTPS